MNHSDKLTNKQLMWAFVAEHYADLFRWCVRAARGDTRYAEELFSDEVLRMLPGLVERWDGKRSFYSYAKSYFFLHLRKKAILRNKRRLVSFELLTGFNPAASDERNSVDDKEYVEQLMSCLSTIERIIVYRSIVLGETTRELAEDLPFSWTNISRKLSRALSLMRAKALEMQQHEAE